MLAKEEREVLLEDGTTAKKTKEEILKLTDSKDKKVRDKAAQAFNEILAKYVDVAEADINAVMAFRRMSDELRGFERPDAQTHLEDDIDSVVVDTVIDAISRSNEVAKHYYELKAKLMGVERLEYHERNVELGALGRYPYEKAVRLVHTALGDVDDQFAEIFKEFVENGQIDAFPRLGKRGGACCSHGLLTVPTYILLNHTDKLDDVLTLAHEVGHGINNELARARQNALNFGTPISTAEVASTFMENFVLEEVIKKADDEQKLAIMMMKLNSDVSKVFRQTAFYKFEQELHDTFRAEGHVAKDDIGNLFKKHMEAYMGEAVEQSPGAENWWVYVPHFRYFFYVSSYVSGELISKSLQNSVREHPQFVEKVKDFLAAGESDSPQNIFAGMGIDITDSSFWEKGVNQIEDLLYRTEDLAKKLGKI